MVPPVAFQTTLPAPPVIVDVKRTTSPGASCAAFGST